MKFIKPNEDEDFGLRFLAWLLVCAVVFRLLDRAEASTWPDAVALAAIVTAALTWVVLAVASVYFAGRYVWRAWRSR